MAGGTATKESQTFRLAIPTAWARAMGISKESRDVILSFEDGKIIVEKVRN